LKLLICILTYNRPEMLRRLLADIDVEAKAVQNAAFEFVVRVYDDHSDEVPTMEGYYHATLIRRPVHGGKHLFWSQMNRLLRDARRNRTWSRLLVLPDDVRLGPRFFARLEAAWRAIPSHEKILLNPLMDVRGPVAHWNAINPVFVDRGPGLYRVGWNDGCWYCGRRLVERFQKFRPPSPKRWRRPYVSTGVGDQLSRWAVANGFTLWQVADSLLWHGTHPSQMHAAP
jgi:hypothetical protein